MLRRMILVGSLLAALVGIPSQGQAATMRMVVDGVFFGGTFTRVPGQSEVYTDLSGQPLRIGFKYGGKGFSGSATLRIGGQLFRLTFPEYSACCVGVSIPQHIYVKSASHYLSTGPVTHYAFAELNIDSFDPAQPIPSLFLPGVWIPDWSNPDSLSFFDSIASITDTFSSWGSKSEDNLVKEEELSGGFTIARVTVTNADSASPVPLPASVWLMTFGIAALCTMSRLRRRRLI